MKYLPSSGFRVESLRVYGLPYPKFVIRQHHNVGGQYGRPHYTPNPKILQDMAPHNPAHVGYSQNDGPASISSYW